MSPKYKLFKTYALMISTMTNKRKNRKPFANKSDYLFILKAVTIKISCQ